MRKMRRCGSRVAISKSYEKHPAGKKEKKRAGGYGCGGETVKAPVKGDP